MFLRAGCYVILGQRFTMGIELNVLVCVFVVACVHEYVRKLQCFFSITSYTALLHIPNQSMHVR